MTSRIKRRFDRKASERTVPEKFTLLLSACGRVRRNCKVIWRSANELGVQFPQA